MRKREKEVFNDDMKDRRSGYRMNHKQMKIPLKNTEFQRSVFWYCSRVWGLRLGKSENQKTELLDTGMSDKNLTYSAILILKSA